MKKEQDNNQEQDEKLLDCLARALILIAKELFQEKQEDDNTKH